jgi:hypothetical protein
MELSFVYVLLFSSLISCSLAFRQSASLRKVLPSTTELKLDLFGLGPTEVAVMVGAGLILFGPDTIKKRFAGNRAGQGEEALGGWMLDRKHKIARMREVADAARRERAAWREDNGSLLDDEEYKER